MSKTIEQQQKVHLVNKNFESIILNLFFFRINSFAE